MQSMTCPRILIFSLLIFPFINTYNVHNRILNKFDNQRFLPLKYNLDSFDNCIPVQAIEQIKCSWISKTDLYNDLFESVCKRHQLCYACGSLHGLTSRHCNHISQIQMFDLCQRKYDCLISRFKTQTLLQKDLFRIDEISSECLNQCVLNYIYFNSK